MSGGMSMAEARAVLGPDVAAQVQAHAASLPPLRPEQIVEVAALLRPTWTALRDRLAADAGVGQHASCSREA